MGDLFSAFSITHSYTTARVNSARKSHEFPLISYRAIYYTQTDVERNLRARGHHIVEHFAATNLCILLADDDDDRDRDREPRLA